MRFLVFIQRIQKTVLAELNKLAMVHLYSHGYDGEALLDFELMLSNPSSVAQQQKLELIRARFEIAGTAPEGMVDKEYIRKQVLGLTDEQIARIEEGRLTDKIKDLEVEGASAEGGGDAGAGDAAGGDDAGGDEGGGLFAGDIKAEEDEKLLTALPATDPHKSNDDDDSEDDDDFQLLSIDDDEAPAKAQKQIRNVFNEPIKKNRKVHSGPASTHMPDFVSMTSVGKATRQQDTSNNPFDSNFLKNPFREGTVTRNQGMEQFLDDKIVQHAKMTREVESTLGKLANAINIPRKTLISESADDFGADLDLEIILGDEEDTEDNE